MSNTHVENAGRVRQTSLFKVRSNNIREWT